MGSQHKNAPLVKPLSAVPRYLLHPDDYPQRRSSTMSRRLTPTGPTPPPLYSAAGGSNIVPVASQLGGADVAGEIAQLKIDVAGAIGRLRGDVAGDIGLLRADVGGEMARLNGEMAQFRAEMARLNGEMAQFKVDVAGEMGQLRGEMGRLRGEMAQLRADVAGEMAQLPEKVREVVEECIRNGLVNFMEIVISTIRG